MARRHLRTALNSAGGPRKPRASSQDSQRFQIFFDVFRCVQCCSRLQLGLWALKISQWFTMGSKVCNGRHNVFGNFQLRPRATEAFQWPSEGVHAFSLCPSSLRGILQGFAQPWTIEDFLKSFTKFKMKSGGPQRLQKDLNGLMPIMEHMEAIWAFLDPSKANGNI